MTEQNNVKILIVDDDKFLLTMYANKFSKFGYEVETAISGDDALAKIRLGYTPVIILTDIIMPKMDGIAFLDEIKKSGLVKEACLIVLSNQGQSADIDRAVKSGIDGYIVKATAIPSEVVEEVSKIYDKKKKAV
ncbi:MAG: response regulator [bacterium]